jgi:hypothetical protein
MRRRVRALLALLPLLLAAMASAGCSVAGLAAPLVKVPKYTPPGETSCGIVPSPSRPLVVEWPALDRAALEARAKQGLVAVRYVGCDIEVLPQCVAPARYTYAYTSTTTKHDSVHIKNEDDLYSNLPLGAAKLEAALKRSGELRVDMTIVGRYSAALEGVPRNELVGPDCARATHVISGLTVGEFDLSAGGRAAVSGGGSLLGKVSAGGSSTASEEDLAQDGDEHACARATGQDGHPPDGCAAPLRIEVTRIGGFRPECPAGFHVQGDACYPELVRQCDPETRYVEGRGCVPERAVPVTSDCPSGFTLRDGWCMPPISTECPEGTRYESGLGCVPVATRKEASRAAGAAASQSVAEARPRLPYIAHAMGPEVAEAEDLLRAGSIRAGIESAMRGCTGGDGFACGVAGEYTRRGGEDFPASPARGLELLRRGCAMNDAWSCTRVVDVVEGALDADARGAGVTRFR